jgi:hypothetical protein
MRKLAILLAAVAAMVTALAGQASAAVHFNIKPMHVVNKCLDVEAVSQANGALAQQWACLGPGQLNQLWTLVPAGGTAVNIVATHSGKCLDVKNASTAVGADVQQWQCLGVNQHNQRWYVTHTSNGRYMIRSAHTGLCLDIRAVGTNNGAKAQMWTCLGDNQLNQRWQLVSN